MERRNQDGWEDERLEALAAGYLECRREMWELLAERLGERWATVEAKVIYSCQHIQPVGGKHHD